MALLIGTDAASPRPSTRSTTPVDPSDRKLYIRAAENSESGKEALANFDAALKTQQTRAANRETQGQLNALGYDTGGVDGIVGAKTDAAIRAFQAANGLTVDGIVGPQTRAALAAAQTSGRTDSTSGAPPSTRSPSAVDAADARVLAAGDNYDQYHFINPRTGREYTDAEVRALREDATAAADTRVLGAGDNYDQHHFINPRTGREYTDAEVRALREDATAAADARVLAAGDNYDQYHFINPRTGREYTDAEVRVLREDAEGAQPSDPYQNVLNGQGTNLDLDDVEARNDGEDHVIIQSIYDPVVSNKPTIVDEFSTVVTLPPDMTPQDLLRQLAGDVDGTLPGVRDHGDFKNQTDQPGVGTISEIDVNGGPIPPGWLSWLPGTVDQSPINAPVVMTEYDPDSHFVFQTIEQNANEHPLHGAREFGFEELDDGRVRIYTRAVAAPDIGGNDIVGATPERRMWTAFVDGVDNYVTENGGQVHSRNITQDTNGPTGDEFWSELPREQQIAIRDSQIDGFNREIQRLELEVLRLRSEGYDDFGIHGRIDDLRSEVAAWEEKEINS